MTITINEPRLFSSELFSANETKSAAYAPEKAGPMSDAANAPRQYKTEDKGAGGREPCCGLTPDKKEARIDRWSGSDASAALAALDGGSALQSCRVNGAVIRARPTVARA